MSDAIAEHPLGRAVELGSELLAELDEERLLSAIFDAFQQVIDAAGGTLLTQSGSLWVERRAAKLSLHQLDAEWFASAQASRCPELRTLPHNGGRAIVITMGEPDEFCACVVLEGGSLDDDAAVAVTAPLAKLATVALRNASRVQGMLETQRLDDEVAISAFTQRQVLPPQPPRVQGLDISVHFRSSRLGCGGDFFDFIPLADESLVFCVANFSGFGTATALLMATVRGYLRATLTVAGPQLGDLVAGLDQVIEDAPDDLQFATAFIGHIDPTRTRLRYCNAGHESGLLVAEDCIEELHAAAPPLGVMVGLVPEASEVPLLPGATLVLATEGFLEAVDSEAPRPQLRNVTAAAAHGRTSSEVRNRIVKTLSPTRHPADQDETLIVIRSEAP
ncbi:MAG: SpoIIE family protein phosphatase [Myxococcota bacterium]